MAEALDLGWAEIARNFADTQDQVENARLRLAEALLSITIDGTTDVTALKEAALLEMALDYRSGIRPVRCGRLS